MEKRLFLPAGHGGEPNISMKMKRFLIKELQRIMNANALSNPVKTKKSVDFPFQTTLFRFTWMTCCFMYALERVN
ncbi:MAG: hypothetical protein JRI63_09845 [Deltaproteobacteria bacterium]|nr:hypothetical protein [Deltaproteobacteria bacterium]